MPSASIFGRDEALWELDRVVTAGGALVVAGEPGSGRTTLLERAAGAGAEVLSTAGNRAEARQPYATLHRLLLADLPRAGTPTALLEHLTSRAPVVCLVDDADHADAESLAALGFVARRAAGSKVAVVFAVREVPESLTGIAVLGLEALNRDASLAVLAPWRLPTGLAASIARAGRGNPLALKELAGALTKAQRRGHAAPPKVLPEGRLRVLLLAAADDDLTVAELLDAIGFDHVDASGLDAVERAGLLDTRGERLRIRPELLAPVAYDEATVAERQAAHRRLARVLDPCREPLRQARHRAAITHRTDDRLAATLARHATDPATRPAVAVAALEEAARLGTEPEGHLVAAASAARRAGEPWRARLLLRRIPSTATASVRAEAETLALRLADAPAPERLVAAAAELADRDRLRAIDALVAAADVFASTGDHDRIGELARRAEKLRQADDPPGLELLAEYLTGTAALCEDDYPRAVEPLRRVQTLAERLDEHPALTRASAAAVLLGDDETARRLGDRAADLARQGGDLSGVPVAIEQAASARFALGRHEEAAESLHESVDLALSSGQTGIAGGHLATLAVLAAVHGDPGTARLRVREARRCSPTPRAGRRCAD
jgi:tetratricopeptide (TPR) repeat protein